MSAFTSVCFVCLYICVFCMSLHLSVLSAFTSVCFVCLYICLFCLSLHLSVLSIFISVCFVCLYICLFCLPLHLFVLSVFTSVCFVCLCICLFGHVLVCLFPFLMFNSSFPILLFNLLSVCASIRLVSFFLSMFKLSTYPLTCLSLHLSVCPPTCVFICLSICLLALSPSVFPFFCSTYNLSILPSIYFPSSYPS
jgi:hypothetical protein